MRYSLSVLTVATVDYVPQSVATLRSVRRHGTYASFHLFVLDATKKTVGELRRIFERDAAWIHVFGPQDLGTEQATFLALFDQYNRMELSCLAKYVGLLYVLGRSGVGEVCLFVDGDMLATGSLQSAVDAMQERAVLLTPHLLEPSSDDIEHDIMNHGWINAGFLAFRRNHPDTQRILRWLIDRISRRGYLAPQYGLSCDQKWISAIPIIFRGQTVLSCERGLNVGYWNLSERPLKRSGETILVNDAELLLFHFSGFNWKASGRLSKHAPIVVRTGSVLEDLCRLYQAELDGVATLATAVRRLERLDCTNADLAERMHAGFLRYKTNFEAPTSKRGFFSVLGGKVDSLFRRTTMWGYRRI